MPCGSFLFLIISVPRKILCFVFVTESRSEMVCYDRMIQSIGGIQITLRHASFHSSPSKKERKLALSNKTVNFKVEHI